jgi:O-antigen/teichoic acid export membrane protein
VARYLAIFGNLSGIAMAIGGWPLLHFVLDDKYPQAAPVIILMAAIAPSLLLFQVVQFAMFGRGRNLDVTLATAAGFIAQLSVDLLTIPRIGIVGAAYGMIAFGVIGFPLLLGLAAKRRVLDSRSAMEIGFAGGVLPGAMLVLSQLDRLRLLTFQ